MGEVGLKLKSMCTGEQGFFFFFELSLEFFCVTQGFTKSS